MKFAKVPRDVKNAIIKEGDILFYSNPSPVWSVVRKVLTYGRDQFPELEVTVVLTDWKGQADKTKRSTVRSEDYRKAKILDLSELREDASLRKELEKIQKSVLANVKKKVRL